MLTEPSNRKRKRTTSKVTHRDDEEEDEVEVEDEPRKITSEVIQGEEEEEDEEEGYISGWLIYFCLPSHLISLDINEVPTNIIDLTEEDDDEKERIKSRFLVLYNDDLGVYKKRIVEYFSMNKHKVKMIFEFEQCPNLGKVIR